MGRNLAQKMLEPDLRVTIFLHHQTGTGVKRKGQNDFFFKIVPTFIVVVIK